MIFHIPVLCHGHKFFINKISQAGNPLFGKWVSRINPDPSYGCFKISSAHLHCNTWLSCIYYQQFLLQIKTENLRTYLRGLRPLWKCWGCPLRGWPQVGPRAAFWAWERLCEVEQAGFGQPGRQSVLPCGWGDGGGGPSSATPWCAADGLPDEPDHSSDGYFHLSLKVMHIRIPKIHLFSFIDLVLAAIKLFLI
jgi:hypothetical protein